MHHVQSYDRKECRYEEELCSCEVLIVFEEECCAATVVGHINSSGPIKYPKLNVYRKLPAKLLTCIP